MFVMKEMLPSYHKWRYTSHGVREQIGKEHGRDGLRSCWFPGEFPLPFLGWRSSHKATLFHVFSGVQVAWSWSWFMRYWTCAMRQTCTAGMRGRLLVLGVPGCRHSPREDLGFCYVEPSHPSRGWAQSSVFLRFWVAFHWTVCLFSLWKKKSKWSRN